MFTMDASQVFNTLIRRIEDSQLNYSMSRTPFSATISLKCSFLNRFSVASQIVILPRTDFQLEQNVKEAEAEKMKLQNEVEMLQNSFDNDQKK